jgi:hypothetical protein
MMSRSLFVAAVLAFVLQLLLVQAVYNGVPDDGRHPFAGFLVYNRSEPTVCGNYLNKCSGSLIDTSFTGIPNAYANRIFLTSAHCLGDQNGVFIGDSNSWTPIADIYVSFQETPAWTDCANRTYAVDTATFPLNYYKVLKAFFPPDVPSGAGTVGSRLGQTSLDYALLLLESDVPITPRALINSPEAPWFVNLQHASDIPGEDHLVDVVGYGRAVQGERDGLGKPTFGGPTRKTFVQLPVQSVQHTGFISQMNIAQDQGTLCLWDSGSAGMVTSQVGATGYPDVVLGLTYGGDANCRAVNTFARVDTELFFQFLRNVVTLLSAL